MNVAKKQAGGRSTVLVGHSMGCRVITEAYLQAPADVAGLVFVDGSIIGGDPDIAIKRARENIERNGMDALTPRSRSSFGCCLHEPVRRASPDTDEISSFRTKDVSTCMGSPTARGSSSASHLRGEDVAFSSRERDRHLGIRPVSLLNTQPVASPVNASR